MKNVAVEIASTASSEALVRFLLRHRRLTELLLDPEMTGAQRTPEWYARRQRIITASICGAIIRGGASAVSAMREKLTSKPRSNDLRESPAACRHGIILEDVVKEVWKKWNKVEIVEGGCIPHPDYPDLLGASPDGIVDTRGVDLSAITPLHGRALEIKCPVSREIKPGKIKTDYWHQMQFQMEVLGFDECQFKEFRVSLGNIPNMADFLASPYELAKGYVCLDGVQSAVKSWTVYLPDEPVDEAALLAAISDADTHVQYWTLHQVQEQVVKYDPTWLATHLETFKTWHAEYMAHMQAGTVPQSPKSKPDYTTGMLLDLSTMKMGDDVKSRRDELPDNPFL